MSGDSMQDDRDGHSSASVLHFLQREFTRFETERAKYVPSWHALGSISQPSLPSSRFPFPQVGLLFPPPRATVMLARYAMRLCGARLQLSAPIVCCNLKPTRKAAASSLSSYSLEHVVLLSTSPPPHWLAGGTKKKLCSRYAAPHSGALYMLPEYFPCCSPWHTCAPWLACAAQRTPVARHRTCRVKIGSRVPIFPAECLLNCMSGDFVAWCVAYRRALHFWKGSVLGM